MSNIKSPIEDALRSGVRDRLWSLVYYALNEALHWYHDPKQLRKEWDELGCCRLTELLIVSAASDSPDWSNYPQTMLVNAWVARFLRTQTGDDIVLIVSEWLDRKPLPPHISEEPGEEDRKVRELKRLLLKMNE